MPEARQAAASLNFLPPGTSNKRTKEDRMFAGMDTLQILAMLSPLVAIQLGLAIYCIVKILRQGTANLNKPLWILISALVNFVGPIAFLLFGRRKDV